MKNNKLKQKWDALPYYTREVAQRMIAAIGVLLFLMAMSQVVEKRNDKEKISDAKIKKEQMPSVPEGYKQFKEAYIKQQLQQQK